MQRIHTIIKPFINPTKNPRNELRVLITGILTIIFTISPIAHSNIIDIKNTATIAIAFDKVLESGNATASANEYTSVSDKPIEEPNVASRLDKSAPQFSTKERNSSGRD